MPGSADPQPPPPSKYPNDGQTSPLPLGECGRPDDALRQGTGRATRASSGRASPEREARRGGRGRVTATRPQPPPSSTHPTPPAAAGGALPFRPLTEIRAGRGGRARTGGGPRAGRLDGRGKGGQPAAPAGCAACVRREAEGGGSREGGGMRARGVSLRLLRLGGKSRTQPERSIKMAAAAAAVAAASGRW